MPGIRMLRAQGSGLLGSLSTVFSIGAITYFAGEALRPELLPSISLGHDNDVRTGAVSSCLLKVVVHHACCLHCKENLAPHKGHKRRPQMCLGLLGEVCFLFLLSP